MQGSQEMHGEAVEVVKEEGKKRCEKPRSVIYIWRKVKKKCGILRVYI